MFRTFEDIITLAKSKGRKRIAVVEGVSEEIVEGLKLAKELAFPVLIGDSEKIKKFAESHGIEEYEVVHSHSPVESAFKACELVKDGRADFLMKGKIDTPTFLRSLLDKERGIRTDKIFSHITLMEVPNYHKLVFLTDAGMNIRPDLKMKISILQNAVEIMKTLGYEEIKVAFLASLETLHEDMPETIEFAAISKLQDRSFFKGIKVYLDGPMGFDIAISKRAAELKGVTSLVSGDADLWMVPDVASGNILAKALIYIAKAKAGGLIYGAKVPVVLLSRADEPELKYYSIAFAVAACG
ncbi:MAG: bifunctional enoyl-CoA hydratase/phosphate acetyltransferase [bacterium]|nr:bifunctional enoyl-CoA hydratase/phosphate acetyltransferase [bacterium]